MNLPADYHMHTPLCRHAVGEPSAYAARALALGLTEIGFSDHSGKIFAPLAAVSLGAEILEVHAVFDRRVFGPDASSSLTIDEIKQVVDGVRFIEKSLNHIVDKNSIAGFERVREIFGKSLSINKDLPVGHILSFEDLETKKPYGRGIQAKEYQKLK